MEHDRPVADPAAGDFTVVICTRNRGEHLRGALTGLDVQSDRAFPVVVVDQSDEADRALTERAASDERLTLVRDEGRGLSRARNLALDAVSTEWVVYLDDDCVPEPDWAESLRDELGSHPEVQFVSGHVGPGDQPPGEYPVLTVFPVETERVRSGRWTRPWDIGFGVCMAIRRSAIDRLGGWDERLGPGVQDFPAADDMDFNYRFLRSGGVALATPAVRSHHRQWRTLEQLGPVYRGYMRAWAGFAMKHLRQGDVVGGTWLWLLGAADPARMLASAVRRRSVLRLRLAGTKLRGVAAGTVLGASRRW